MSDLQMCRAAMFSPCGKYRYWLSRQWSVGPEATFIMLNPSTADAKVDDPTIRKCIGFARRWGMTGLQVVNLFGIRATDPADMMKAGDPIGPDNMDYISRLCDGTQQRGGIVVCAWGTKGEFRGQDRRVLKLLHGLAIQTMALKLTKGGHPQHPLYVGYAVRPIFFDGAREGRE